MVALTITSKSEIVRIAGVPLNCVSFTVLGGGIGAWQLGGVVNSPKNMGAFAIDGL